MTGFQMGINLIFSLFNRGDNIMFPSLRSENDLFINFNLLVNSYD